MSEYNSIYTPVSFFNEYNALVVEYAKLEERARTAMIERISILLAAKVLNERYDALLKAAHKDNLSPEFRNMVGMLGHTDSDLNGDVRALQCSYTPKS
jgi:hypothetical protein